ncbi:MAG: hypothetical protein NTV34_14850 [Proteobacteria bacterium]|nr:hypothetical protein [Pseudomonadota bacterium]
MKSQGGFSLLEVIISIGFATILIGLTGRFISDTMDLNSKLEMDSELEDLRRDMRARFDCRVTINPRPEPCDDATMSTYLPLKSMTGATIVTSTFDQPSDWVGNYHLRARCIDYPIGAPLYRAVWIEYRKETDYRSNLAAKNPLDDLYFTWTPLFEVPACTLSL